VSGTELKVISLKRVAPWKKEDLTDKLSLLYSIPKKGSYEVMVHSPYRLYKMLQSRIRNQRTIDLETGLFNYSWDAKVVRSLAIPSSDLFCLITASNSREIVPAAIVPTSLVSTAVLGGYEISVLPNKDVKDLKLTLQDSKGVGLYETLEFKSLPRDLPISFEIPVNKLPPGDNILSFIVTFEGAAKSDNIQRTIIIPASQ
jgi:hypothetical protein